MSIEYEILGATAMPALLVQVRNIPELVARQGGAPGAAVQALAPRTIANKVYTEMQKRMTSEFAKQGVDVDVRVVASAQDFGPPPRGEFLTGAAVGASAVGFAWVVKALVSYLLRKG